MKLALSALRVKIEESKLPSEDEIRSVEGPGAMGGGPEGTAPQRAGRLRLPNDWVSLPGGAGER